MARREAPANAATELLLLNNAKYLLKGGGGAAGVAAVAAGAQESGHLLRGAAPAAAGDSAHARALGRFGPWQLRTLLLVALVKAPSAWQMAAILFTAPSPNADEYWCSRPPGARQHAAEVWRNYSHVSLGETFDPCNIYTEAYNMILSEELIPFDKANATIQPCVLFEFNSSITAVTQWNLVCQRQILISVSQFFYLLGILVGGALCTKLLSRFAPRRLLLAGMLVQIVAGIGVAFSTFIQLQMFLRFVTAAACAHMFTAGYVICTGNTEGRTRVIMGSCYEHFWSLGVITLPCLASLFEDWRHFQLAISIPTIFLLVLYCWIPESPLWLLNVGRKVEAKIILDKAAFCNNEVLIATTPVDPIRPSTDCEPHKYDLNVYCYTALHIAWAATVVTYYGALLNVKSIGIHLFLYTGLAGLAEIIGVLLGLSCMLWSSSKWIVLGFVNILGGSLCFLSWVLPMHDMDTRAWIMLIIAMIARIAIAASLNMLTVVSPDLLPKHRRQSVMFSAVTLARVFLLSAPFIGSLAMYGDSVSLSAFGGLTAIAGIAVIPLQKADNLKNNLKNLENSNGSTSLQNCFVQRR